MKTNSEERDKVELVLLDMDRNSIECKRCETRFDYTPVMWGNRETFVPKWCEACAEVLVAEEEARLRRMEQEARRKAFMRKVPPLYRETDIARLLPVLAQLATEWKYSPMGIGLIGVSGTGKTRTAVLIAARMSDEGRSVFYVSATDYAAAAAGQWSDDARERSCNSETLRQARRAQVLVLDDLGKNKMTDRAEATLYELLEERTSHMLPTIWTSNARAKELHAMFSPDRADAMLRRLGSDFNRVVKV